MVKAIWNNQIIAESDNTVVVEGNHYFPLEALNMEFFKPAAYTSICAWKGTANYFDIHVQGKKNEHAAWVYKSPKDAAKEIANRVAFWKGVEVTG